MRDLTMVGMNEVTRSSNAKSLRERAEELVRARPGEIPIDDVKVLVHELEVYQAELELQNEELGRAEQDLVESRNRYADLYNFAPIGYVTLDAGGTIFEANLTAADLLGVERVKLIGAKFSDFVERYDQDGFYLHRQNVLSTRRKQSCDLAMHRADGTPLLIRLDSIASADAFDESFHWRAALIDMTEQRRLEHEVLEIAESEQRRFGQELHDDLGQRLIATTMFVHILRTRLVERSAPETELADQIAAHVDDTVRALRQYSRGLVPIDLNADSLISALHALAGRIGSLDDVECTLAAPARVRVDDDLAATYLFRIVQEATSNAIRHGHAHHIHIELQQDAESLTLRIDDDGDGFEPAPEETGGVGLRSMQYRADVIGARLTIESAPKRGTIVTCQLPVSMDRLNSHNPPSAPAK